MNNIFSAQYTYQDIIRLTTLGIICVVLILLLFLIFFHVTKHKTGSLRPLRYKRTIILLYTAVAVLAILVYYYAYIGINSISIVEFCRRTEVDGMDASYVVIRNNGKWACDIRNLYLSDSEDDLKKYQISDTVLGAGDTLRIVISGNEDLHIKKKGGSVLLLTRAGDVIDSVEIPRLYRNESYVRMDSGWNVINIASSSVGSPIFSEQSGFYSKGFRLQIESPDGYDIYYTTDGSVPTTESTKYSRPINVYDRSSEDNVYLNIQNVVPDYINEWKSQPLVDKAFVVRAVCIDDEGNKSDMVSKSYFVGLDKYEHSNVISLIADPNDLFGDNGIYSAGREYDDWYTEHLSEAKELPRSESDEGSFWDDEPEPNWEKKGMEWEREADMSYYENGVEVLNQPVGIRIQGHGWGRYGALKRFSVFSRKQYSGDKYFDVSLFDDTMTHSIVLRQGDFHALIQTLVNDRDIVTSPVKKVSVFLNGEFWYETYMLEKANSESLLSNRYNVSESNISIVKNGQSTNDDEGNNPFSAMYDYIEDNPLDNDDNYYRFGEIIDIQSYIDSSCIQIYISDMDYQEKWNNYLWHTIEYEDDRYGDTRWRWGLYDVDNHGQGFDCPEYEVNPFTMAGSTQPGPITEWPVFSSLRVNDDFCRQFVLTFMDIVNTDFQIDQVMNRITELQIDDESIRDFFANRAEYVVPYMAEEFELTGSLETVSIGSNRSGNPVLLNTISPDLTDGFWEGLYYTDYPVTVSASEAGFDHWEVTVGGTTSTYYDTMIELPIEEGGIRVYAVYK